MIDYTPTTDEVRACYSYRADWQSQEDVEAFDRWLAAHDAEIMQQAYELAGKLANSFLDTVRADEREKDYEYLIDAGFIGAATELRDARGGEQL